MFACLIFGDSLASGVGQAINARYAPHCDVRAVVGAASGAMLRWRPAARRYDTAVLSMGSNDDIGSLPRASVEVRGVASSERLRARSYERIRHLRLTLESRRVIWLLPYDRVRAGIVQSIAVRFGDEVLDIASFPTSDGLHPASYDAVARHLLR